MNKCSGDDENSEYARTIGVNLKHQREKLGLSQEQAAKKLGVTTRTQSNYENGKRTPDMNYLIEARNIGIDLTLLLFGEEDPLLLADIAMKLVEKAFAIDSGDLVVAYDDIITPENCDDITSDTSPGELLFNELLLLSPVFRSIVDRRVSLDEALLSEILVQVNVTIDTLGLTMARSKQAQAVAMLYRSFKPSGKVNQNMIEDAVKLASS